MNNYKESYEKYKDYLLPEINQVFHNNGHPIRVVEYFEDFGVVETVKSGQKRNRTLHWIRKCFNTPS